jgi:hypothetical protein
MRNPPESMVAELSAWNDGDGIDLESWVQYAGNFKLFVGYSAFFWPRFTLFEDYILREGFSMQTLRGFERDQAGNKASIESVMNHQHIADIHGNDHEGVSEDKIVFLGKVLKEIYEAKLRSQFPDRPCVVKFYEPEDRTNLVEYQLSFWQKKHEKKN